MSQNLRKIFHTYQKQTKASWTLIEQDYLLSWVLKGISLIPELQTHLVFKGGTCLRKCYFGNYRFSQDLDFSILGDAPKGPQLQKNIEEALKEISQEQRNDGLLIEYALSRYVEKKPHPQNQEAFTISARYPWQREALTRVMIEITTSEKVLLPIKEKKIIHVYEDFFESSIKAYSLEEIIIEKICALRHFSIKLHERGWGRSRARDYYDLWRILKDFKEDLHPPLIRDFLPLKCHHKNLSLTSIQDIFENRLMEDLQKSWTLWVKPLTQDLPPLENALKELQEELNLIFPGEIR